MHQLTLNTSSGDFVYMLRGFSAFDLTEDGVIKKSPERGNVTPKIL